MSAANTKRKTATKTGAEGRRTPRRIFERPIGILCGGQYHLVRALQLSEGGLLFTSDIEFEEKMQVVTTLILPGGGAVVARGEIIYEKTSSAKGRQFGVRFNTLPLNVRRSIRNYVTAKTQAEAEREAGEPDSIH